MSQMPGSPGPNDFDPSALRRGPDGRIIFGQGPIRPLPPKGGTPSGQMYAGGDPNFDEMTGMRTGGFKPMRPPTKGDIKSLPFRPGMPPGPFTPGEGGMSPGQLPTGGARTMEFIDANNNGVDDRDERPQSGVSDSLFGTQGSGTYDNLMSRSFQEYSSGQSPYEGASSFLMNRPAFDRGARPESSMPSTSMPSYSYSDPGGAGGLAQLQAQQPGLQAQYDQFAQQIQSAQEAAQQQAQQQTDMAASERQALMDRIAALEGQEGPDLDAFGSQLRQDILGQIPEQIDIDALRREITGEVLSVAQQEFPDVTQIRDEVMRLLPEPEQIDVENLRRQIQESIDAGAPPEEIEALRQELQNRIRPVEEQLATIQDERPDIARQLGELRGELGALPDIDVNELRAQIISQLPEQERVDIETLQRQIQEGLDSGMSSEQLSTLREELQNRLRPVEEQIQSIQDERPDITRQIGELRGQLGALPDIDVEQIRQSIISQLPEQERVDIESLQRRIQESIDAGAPEQEVAGLRAELNQRLTPVEERVNSVRESVAQFRQQFDPSSISEQIGNLRGRLEGLPNIDIEDIRRRVAESIEVNQPTEINPDVQRQIEELRGHLAGQGQSSTPDRVFLPPEVRERLDALEGRQGPDLSTIREQIGELRGQLGRDRELPPEVLQRLRAVEQREGPDEAAIAERVRSGIDPRIADLQERFGRVDVSNQGMAERLAALRERGDQARQERSTLEERLGARLEEVGGRVDPLAERIAQLRGRLDERPTIDQDALARRVRESIKIPRFDEAAVTRRIKESITPQKVDVDALRRQIQEGIKVPTVDLGGIREQIGQLRGRLDERPQLSPDAVQRMIKESMANRTTAGIKPQPQVKPRVSAFPPGYRGGPI